MDDNVVYIMSNYQRNVLYIGVTSDIWRRVIEHKTGCGCAYSSRYQTKYLIYYEEFQYINDAIDREKQLKNWKRQWKIDLIKEDNPDLSDLSMEWYSEKDIEEFLEFREYGIDPESSSG